MLDGRDHEPAPSPPARLLERQEHALEREVVGLGGRRGEDDLLGKRADQRGHAGAGLFDRLARGLAPAMHRGGVAEGGAQEGRHRGERLGGHPGGGGVIGVDLAHGRQSAPCVWIETRWARWPAISRSARAYSLPGSSATTGRPSSPPRRTAPCSGTAPR